jgi:hypothetical protein
MNKLFLLRLKNKMPNKKDIVFPCNINCKHLKSKNKEIEEWKEHSRKLTKAGVKLVGENLKFEQQNQKLKEDIRGQANVIKGLYNELKEANKGEKK